MPFIYRNPKIKEPEFTDTGRRPDAGITDPGRGASTMGVAAPGVVKPGVQQNTPKDPYYIEQYTDTGTGAYERDKNGNIIRPDIDYNKIGETVRQNWNASHSTGGGDGLPYGIGEAAAEGADLAALIGEIGYTAPGVTGGGAADPRIAQYQQQLQAYLDQYNQPVSYDKTWGDYAYEDLIRQALGMNYEDWTQGDQYAALRDRYTENGRNAMLDTLGQISARTGGLASSYASAASAQQYNEYMKLLEDAARAAYDKERGYVIENAGLAQGVGNQEYNRWYDITGLNNANRDRAVGILNDMLGYAYRDDDTAYSRGMTARDEARDRIASYLGNGGSIGDLDPALITASGLTTPELTKLEAAYQQPVVSYGGGGSGSGSGSSESGADNAQAWAYLDAMVSQNDEGYSDVWLENNYKALGFKSAKAAQSAYKQHRYEAGLVKQAEPEYKPTLTAAQAKEAIDNGVINDTTRKAYEYYYGPLNGSQQQSAPQMTEQDIRAGIANQTQRDAGGNIIVEIQGNSPYGGSQYLTLAELRRAVENGQVREITKNGKQVYTWNY